MKKNVFKITGFFVLILSGSAIHGSDGFMDRAEDAMVGEALGGVLEAERGLENSLAVTFQDALINRHLKRLGYNEADDLDFDILSVRDKSYMLSVLLLLSELDPDEARRGDDYLRLLEFIAAMKKYQRVWEEVQPLAITIEPLDPYEEQKAVEIIQRTPPPVAPKPIRKPAASEKPGEKRGGPSKKRKKFRTDESTPDAPTQQSSVHPTRFRTGDEEEA